MSKHKNLTGKYVAVHRGRHIGVFFDLPSIEAAIGNFSQPKFDVFDDPVSAVHCFGSAGLRTLLQANGTIANSTAVAKQAKQKHQPQERHKLLDELERKRRKQRRTIKRREIEKLHIYCEGHCSSKASSASGVGVAVYDSKLTLKDIHYGEFEALSNDNKVELKALREGLLLFKNKLEVSSTNLQAIIYSDSHYAINCVIQWADGWRKRGWKTPNGDPVENLGLVHACIYLLDELHDHVTVRHVKVHSDGKGKKLAVALAKLAITKQTKLLVQLPVEIGPMLKHINPFSSRKTGGGK